MFSPYLESLFPNLRSRKYDVTSPHSQHYNCIAWAAAETHRKWWPIGGHWPPGVPREETVGAFILAFAERDYEPCIPGTFENGYEKVVIYVDAAQIPTHMARQLPSGTWSSKLGDLEDIEHATPHELEGNNYGVAVQYLKRPSVSHKRRSLASRLVVGLLRRIFGSR
jgi:hypothetical protein